MLILSALAWIGNAAAVLLGRHGDVTHAAHDAGCSRQAAYDHAAKVLHAVHDARHDGPTRQQLRDENQRLRDECQRLRRQQRDLVCFNHAQRRRFAATGAAMGLSTGQTQELLGIVLDKDAPKRATVGRWVLDAARTATAVLEPLDEAARPLAEVLCPDEIFFHGRPILVGVEPGSMALLLCHKAADRTGATWEQALSPFTGLEAVVRDAGTGLSAGVALIDQQRLTQGRPPLEDSLDLFHTDKEAHKPLGWHWRLVERIWQRAEQAEAKLRAAQEKGRNLQGPAARARAAWRLVDMTWASYEQRQAQWQRVKAALAMFRPDGQLNDRAWAEAELREAVKPLGGKTWKKVRALLSDRRALTFLDRMHRRLTAAEPRVALRVALCELWRLEEGPGRGESGPGGLVGMVQRVVCAKLASDWGPSYQRVRAVLRSVVRASSAVECVNSVLRMHQSRHRQVTQALLDLKRLYWNCRPFRSGKRRKACPYELLGLKLPTYAFWEVLHLDPAQLKQQLSTPKVPA
jgi:hypothetical protein